MLLVIVQILILYKGMIWIRTSREDGKGRNKVMQHLKVMCKVTKMGIIKIYIILLLVEQHF